jgi:hypothetical protein
VGGQYFGPSLLDNHAIVLRFNGASKSWDSVFDTASPKAIFSRALVANREGHIFAGIDRQGLYSTNDYGTHWNKVNPDTLGCFFALAVDSAGGVLVGACGGIYRSGDEGQTWDRIGLAGEAVMAIVVNSPGHIFAGTYSKGIFRSIDSGSTWDSINTGLGNNNIHELALAPDGHAFVQTGNGDAYRSVESTTSVKDIGSGIPMSFFLRQNNPNPFNPSTSISFSIPKGTHVRLQVFNVLGQFIQTLFDEDKQPGTYSVTWDARTRPSGLYFYRMTAGEFAQTKKALFLN